MNWKPICYSDMLSEPLSKNQSRTETEPNRTIGIDSVFIFSKNRINFLNLGLEPNQNWTEANHTDATPNWICVTLVDVNQKVKARKILCVLYCVSLFFCLLWWLDAQIAFHNMSSPKLYHKLY